MSNGPVFPVQKRNHKYVSVRFLYVISTHLSKSYGSPRSCLIHTWHCIHWNHKGNVLILEEQIPLQFCIPSNDLIENREYLMVFHQEERLRFAEVLLWGGQHRGSNSLPGMCTSPLSFLDMASWKSLHFDNTSKRGLRKCLFSWNRKHVMKQMNALSTWCDVDIWFSSSTQ